MLLALLTILACSEEKAQSSEEETIEPSEEPSTEPSSETDEPPPIVGINPRIHRLTHPQWNNSVQDLLGVEALEFSSQFLDDGLSEGFENNGDSLSIGAILFQDYQRAAESLAGQVVSDLEIYANVAPEDIRIGGSTIAYSQRFEGEDALGTTGAPSGSRYNLWSNGNLSIEPNLTASGLYEISTLVTGTDCGDGLGADMEIRLDGTILIAQTVLEEEEVSVTTDISAGTHTVSIAFTNDCYDAENGFDRNLLIDWIDLVGGIDLGASSTSIEDMNPWVERFVEQAFRRLLLPEELNTWNDVFAQGDTLINSGDAIADGVELVVMAVLQSPDFLYRIEHSEAGTRLSDYELAAKLSFQLCSQPPDQEQREALIDGSFLDDYREHAERLLMSECGQNSVLELHRELFQLDSYDNIYKTDPLWNTELNQFLRQEVEEFITWHIYTENGTVKGLYTADYTIGNSEIASLYGIELESTEFVRIELDPNERSGILTLAGPLAEKAEIAQSSPIHRGVFINHSILCKELLPPPDVITGLPSQEDGMTNRERVEAHTGDGTCGEGCHSALINPPGFAFENYDELGRYRTEDNLQPIDAADSFYFANQGLMSWTTGVEFSQIVSESYEAHQCYNQHLLSYVLGRELQDLDSEFLEELRMQSMQDQPIQELIIQIVESESFQYRGLE